MDKIFVLGLGAQKSGTSWLRHYLNSYDHADFGLAKEYHVWDVICESARFSHYDFRNDLKISLKRFVKERLNMDLGPLDVRQKMQNSPDYYFQYFKSILSRPGISITGDISPSYVFLPSSVLQKIRDNFISMGIEVKVLFLVRDPVERCWSSVRMHRRKGVSMEGVDVNLPLEEALGRYYRTIDCVKRTRYQDTISIIEDVFLDQEIFYDTYENIFLKNDLTGLSSFLNLEENKKLLHVKYETTEKIESISEALYTEIAEFYADVYEKCELLIPNSRLLWPGFKYLCRES